MNEERTLFIAERKRAYRSLEKLRILMGHYQISNFHLVISSSFRETVRTPSGSEEHEDLECGAAIQDV